MEKAMLSATAEELEYVQLLLSQSRHRAAEIRSRLTTLLGKLDRAGAAHVRATIEHLEKADEMYNALLDELTEAIRAVIRVG